MGICLDTEQSDGSQTFEESRGTWVQNTPKDPRNTVTPPDGKFPMLNGAKVQFESPKVPVIFVLGGPGSGKVTHCDSLMEEKRGITHINMTDLLQQYAIGNDIEDFGQLSSKTVTEVLMLEMKMAPNAKTFLVSGYPRNMRDVVEYSDKIQIINGVIIISWRQNVLERQIDYGAKLGQVVLSLARIELNNFYKNVIPVADYFDQSNMLITINGERHPSDVYKDFRTAVFRILGQQDNPPIFANGKVGTIPSDVTTELPNKSQQTTASTTLRQTPRNTSATSQQSTVELERPKTQVISVNANHHSQNNYQTPMKNGYPPVVWVLGGPGSNKAILCSQVARETGWTHISLGKLLRAAAEPPIVAGKLTNEQQRIKECISNGELVPLDIVMKFIESHMAANMSANGIILDGFPRDMTQATEFEAKFKHRPSIVLLDCSKLQLGRGRLDDSVTAFRRRLEIFRHSSLPMLKTMDNIDRLTIVDGDTDAPPVQEDFKRCIRDNIQHIINQNMTTNQMNNSNNNSETTLQDLETEPIDTISKNVSNGHTMMANGVNHLANGHVSNKSKQLNGHVNGTNHQQYTVLNGDRNLRQMYNEVNYMDGHI